MKTTESRGEGVEQAPQHSGLESVGSRRRLLLGGAATLAGAGLLLGSRTEAQTQPPSRVFDVRAYGAVGDGCNDDTTAVENAMTAAWTQGGVVYLPPGRHRCTRKLLLAPTSTAPNTPSIALLGNGRGVSSLEFTASGSGIEIHFANADRQLTVSGLSIKAGVPHAGSALWVSWPHDFGPYARAHIEDVELCPVDSSCSAADGGPAASAVNFWNYGIRLEGGHCSVIRAVWFRGKSTSRESACAIDLVNSNDVSISGCHTNFSDIAINIAGGAALGDIAGCEGTVIRDCYMVGHTIGVRSLSGIGQGLPWIEVSSSHIFATFRGIQIRNRNEATFAHNIIYQADTTQFFVGIECQDNCTEASIHDNRFVHKPEGPYGGWGVVLSGQYSQVNHNIGTMAPCVVLRNQATSCVALENISRVTNAAAVVDELAQAGNQSNKVSLSQPF